MPVTVQLLSVFFRATLTSDPSSMLARMFEPGGYHVVLFPGPSDLQCLIASSAEGRAVFPPKEGYKVSSPFFPNFHGRIKFFDVVVLLTPPPPEALWEAWYTLSACH